MIVSLGLPTGMEGMMYPIPFVSPEAMRQIARRAEALGYHSVWGNDHMTTQRYVREEASAAPNFYEVLMTLAFVAAETTTLRIATGVLVPAMRRDIVVLAKQLATLDQFSGGRLIVGMGVGAYREEFEALSPGRQVRRGDLLEESIAALRLLFRERRATWQGRYYEFSDVEMYPKPVQDPLPIYVGGNNVNALRRTASHGQGWMGAGLPADQLQSSVERLRAFAAELGRDAGDIDVAPQYVACIGRTHEEAVSKFEGSQMYKHLVSLRHTTLKDQMAAGTSLVAANLIGTADEIVEKIERLSAAGATHVSGLLFPATSIEDFDDQITHFAEAVIPRVAPA